MFFASAPVLALLLAAPRLLTFHDVLEAIRAKNYSLSTARAVVDVADADVRKAWVGWKPRLNAIGSVTINSTESTFDSGAALSPFVDQLNTIVDRINAAELIEPIPQFELPSREPTVIAPRTQVTGVLALSQTLFNIAVLRAPQVAEAARRVNAERVDVIEDELFFSGATLYATLGGLKALEAAAERAILVADRRLDDARAQVEAGSATRLSITRAETDRVVAEGQQRVVRSRRRSLLASLRALIATDEDIDVEDEPLEKHVTGTPPGHEGRTSVRVRRLEVEAAERSVGLWDLAWLPTLTLEGTLRQTNAEGFSGERLSGTATLNLAIPLYDGGLRYAETEAAEMRVVQVSRALEQERLSARAYLEDAEASLETARSELAQAEAQLRLATEAVQQAEELVGHGLATNLELTDADGKRFSADRSVVQKMVDLDLARLRVFYASGGRLLR